MAFAFISKVQEDWLSAAFTINKKKQQKPTIKAQNKWHFVWYTPVWDINYSRYEKKRQKHSFIVGYENRCEHHSLWRRGLNQIRMHTESFLYSWANSTVPSALFIVHFDLMETQKCLTSHLATAESMSAPGSFQFQQHTPICSPLLLDVLHCLNARLSCYKNTLIE